MRKLGGEVMRDWMEGDHLPHAMRIHTDDFVSGGRYAS